MRTRKSSKRKMATQDSVGQSSDKKTCQDSNIKLKEAVERGDISAVMNILKDESLNLSNLELNKVFLKATEQGKKRIVQLLLLHGVDVSGESHTGNMALLSAAEHGYLDIVKMLVKKGTSVDMQNAEGKTALMLAVEKSCCSAITLFLLDECGANPNVQDNEGRTALMHSVDLWDFETVQILLGCKGLDKTIKDKNGLTALCRGTRNGSALLLYVLTECKELGMPALILALRCKKYEVVKQLLEIDPSCVRCCTEDGFTPLAVAMGGMSLLKSNDTLHCSLKLLELLLKAGVDVNTPHPNGGTPLMMATSAASTSAVKMLLQHGSSVNAWGSGNQTALMAAAFTGCTDILKLLLEAGAHPFLKDTNDDTALDFAVRNEDKESVRVLLKCCGKLELPQLKEMENNDMLWILTEVYDRWEHLFDRETLSEVFLCAVRANCCSLVTSLIDYGVDINTHVNQTFPLLEALHDLNMVCLLLDKGADVNVRRALTGQTALMRAVCEGDVPLIRVLLKYKADMYEEFNGCTSLILASQSYKGQELGALLEEGVDVNHVTTTKKTALLCAVRANKYTATEMLIRKGADVNFVTSDGSSILMHAVRNCTSNFAELLVKNGADVNVVDQNGETALFHALRHSITREDKVTLLVQHGADINHSNSKKVTPLMVAARYCRANILDLLVQLGAKATALDQNGDSALHFATLFSDDADKVKVLVNSGAGIDCFNSNYENPLIIALKSLKEKSIRALVAHGASVNFQTSSSNDGPNQQWMWKRGVLQCLHRFLDIGRGTSNFIKLLKCIEPVLEAGCLIAPFYNSFDYEEFLSNCIILDARKTVQLLLQSGVGPWILQACRVPGALPPAYFTDHTYHNFNSSMCVAIISRRFEMIAFFSQCGFYHKQDVRMLQDPIMKRKLKALLQDWPHKDLPVPSELSPNSWSLQTWSKLAVNQAIGYHQDRESRIRALQIPKCLQDKLLCKNMTFPGGLKKLSKCSLPAPNLGLDARD